jgi:O-antigen/teichoic acid export membrane protein
VWDVVVYEVADRPDARRIYVLVFEYFVNALLLLMLGVSLFAQPAVSLLLPVEYAAAGWLIPIVCLAFVFFSLHGHFRVPAMLAKQTGSLVLSPAVAATANILLNLLLIPMVGVIAAALTSVVTYGLFSFVGLWQYRRFARLDYPFKRCGFVLLAMVGSFEACQAASAWGLPMDVSLGLRSLVWVSWAGALLMSMRKRWLDHTVRGASHPS